MSSPPEDPDQRSAGRSSDVGEQRFQLLVESVMDYAIFMLEPDGRVASWNVGAERLKGYTEEEILGRHYSTFYPDEDRQARLPDRLLARAREEGRAAHSGWRVRRDGSKFWADVVITALFDDDGTLAGFAKVTRDMTETHLQQQTRQQALAEKERAVEALAEVDAWRRDFLSAMAHDLQTPVVAIAGFARLFLEDWPDVGEEDRDFVERILSNAESLEGLIENLRAYAHLESGRVRLEPEPVELDRLVEDVLADMEPVLREHEVRGELPAIRLQADPRGLERILRNLLANAARHTPTGAGITVSARASSTDDAASGTSAEPDAGAAGGDAPGTAPEGAVEVAISDEGEGIDEAVLDRLFDRFARGTGGRTGLGLAIVRDYVELHGGRVEADSTPGQGTTIRFTLPRQQTPGTE